MTQDSRYNQQAMSLHSRHKLKAADADRFVNAKPDLFAEIARVVCRAGILPEKELHECWQMANFVHKAFPVHSHIADIAAGHGLLAWILVLLARSGEVSIPRTAVAVDIERPKSAARLAASFLNRWPNLADSVHYVEGSLKTVHAAGAPTLFVAAHACGGLSDQVLLAAIRSRSPVAIMPCCHSLRKQGQSLKSLAQASNLPDSVVDRMIASQDSAAPCILIDQFRREALLASGYEISEDSIDSKITTFHRIMIGRPPEPRGGVTNIMAPFAAAPHQVKQTGEIRAFEKIHSLNVADIEAMQTLSQRPSREWFRFFDLSFWVEDDAAGHRVASALDFLTQKEGGDSWFTKVRILDRYTDPETERLSYTYRIEVRSSSAGIDRMDALALRKQLCSALPSHLPELQNRLALRSFS